MNDSLLEDSIKYFKMIQYHYIKLQTIEQKGTIPNSYYDIKAKQIHNDKRKIEINITYEYTCLCINMQKMFHKMLAKQIQQQKNYTYNKGGFI